MNIELAIKSWRFVLKAFSGSGNPDFHLATVTTMRRQVTITDETLMIETIDSLQILNTALLDFASIFKCPSN